MHRARGQPLAGRRGGHRPCRQLLRAPRRPSPPAPQACPCNSRRTLACRNCLLVDGLVGAAALEPLRTVGADQQQRDRAEIGLHTGGQQVGHRTAGGGDHGGGVPRGPAMAQGKKAQPSAHPRAVSSRRRGPSSRPAATASGPERLPGQTTTSSSPAATRACSRRTEASRLRRARSTPSGAGWAHHLCHRLVPLPTRARNQPGAGISAAEPATPAAAPAAVGRRGLAAALGRGGAALDSLRFDAAHPGVRRQGAGGEGANPPAAAPARGHGGGVPPPSGAGGGGLRPEGRPDQAGRGQGGGPGGGAAGQALAQRSGRVRPTGPPNRWTTASGP